MLNDMLQFNISFLNALATFLRSEPMIYFVALFMLAIIVAIFASALRR